MMMKIIMMKKMKLNMKIRITQNKFSHGYFIDLAGINAISITHDRDMAIAIIIIPLPHSVNLTDR